MSQMYQQGECKVGSDAGTTDCACSLSCVQLFVTPWSIASQVPLSLGFSQQGYWSGLPFPPPGELPWSRHQTHVSCIGRQIFTTEPSGNPTTDCSVQFSSVQSLSRVQLFVTPWITARQASLSITNSQSLLKLMSIELVVPSNHLILCRPFLLPPTFEIIILIHHIDQRPVHHSIKLCYSQAFIW